MTFLFLPTHLQFEAPEHPMVNKQRLNMFDRAAQCREGGLQTVLRFNQLHIYRNTEKKGKAQKEETCSLQIMPRICEHPSADLFSDPI